MKIVGALVLGVGVLLGIVGLSMDTTVYMGRNIGYVHNLQKAQNRNIVMGAAALGVLTGVILFGFGAVAPPPRRKPVSKKVAQQIDAAKLAEHRSEEMADDFLDSMR
jgi:H+/Cl- antiporter ClcA